MSLLIWVSFRLPLPSHWCCYGRDEIFDAESKLQFSLLILLSLWGITLPLGIGHLSPQVPQYSSGLSHSTWAALFLGSPSALPAPFALHTPCVILPTSMASSTLQSAAKKNYIWVRLLTPDHLLNCLWDTTAWKSMVSMVQLQPYTPCLLLFILYCLSASLSPPNFLRTPLCHPPIFLNLPYSVSFAPSQLSFQPSSTAHLSFCNCLPSIGLDFLWSTHCGQIIFIIKCKSDWSRISTYNS